MCISLNWVQVELDCKGLQDLMNSRRMSQTLIDSDMMARLEQLQLIARRMATGRMRGERRSNRRGISTDFADYRNYVSGDDIRHLDWKIYARLERLCLKRRRLL